MCSEKSRPDALRPVRSDLVGDQGVPAAKVPHVTRLDRETFSDLTYHQGDLFIADRLVCHRLSDLPVEIG